MVERGQHPAGGWVEPRQNPAGGSNTGGCGCDPQRARAADAATSAAVAAPEGDLVIGIGNTLRGDDGVGWWLAQRAERWRPAVQVRVVQQLTPELAAELAPVNRVLFIDAWLGPAEGGWPDRKSTRLNSSHSSVSRMPSSA